MREPTLEQRLQGIEARLRALEAGEAADSAPAHPPPEPSRRDSRLWAVEGLQRHLGPQEGGVVYAGRFVDEGGSELRWQIGRTQQDLLGDEWSDLAPRLAALGHPVRLQLLRSMLQGVSAVADLGARPGMGTSGQLYHHLRELESAGWLHSPQRGSYLIRPERVVSLLAVLAAARQ